jgi:hypothetical protein
MPSRLFTPEQERTITRRYQAGESGPALAREYNTTPTTIGNIVKRTGGTMRGAAISAVPSLGANVLALYDGGLSIREIARRAPVDAVAVRCYLRFHGRPVRRPYKPRKPNHSW